MYLLTPLKEIFSYINISLKASWKWVLMVNKESNFTIFLLVKDFLLKRKFLSEADFFLLVFIYSDRLPHIFSMYTCFLYRLLFVIFLKRVFSRIVVGNQSRDLRFAIDV